MLEAEVVTQCDFVSITMQEIQHLPWESIPMLFDQPVTRVPSLQFLLSKVQSQVVHCKHLKNFAGTACITIQ